mmetsp:Transcript_29494/g.80971  ORF Transcript_29494/g.80971 Transcript_29494/m.80971 type:complete len:227 (-) Transcript_29494:1405-2085(-)
MPSSPIWLRPRQSPFKFASEPLHLSSPASSVTPPSPSPVLSKFSTVASRGTSILPDNFSTPFSETSISVSDGTRQRAATASTVLMLVLASFSVCNGSSSDMLANCRNLPRSSRPTSPKFLPDRSTMVFCRSSASESDTWPTRTCLTADAQPNAAPSALAATCVSPPSTTCTDALSSFALPALNSPRPNASPICSPRSTAFLQNDGRSHGCVGSVAPSQTARAAKYS